MLTMRATPKISEKPIASSAYTPPFTRPVTRMSCSIGRKRRACSGQQEGLHPLDLLWPERDLLAVLPLHCDARGLTDRPDRIVRLVPGERGGGADVVLQALQHRHQLVGVGGACLLDRVLEDHDRVVGR